VAGAAVNNRARRPSRPGPGVAEWVVSHSKRNGQRASISQECANTRIDLSNGRSKTGSEPKPIRNAFADGLANTGAHHRSEADSNDDP